jgi:cytochrome c oxidase accessory protein FixG
MQNKTPVQDNPRVTVSNHLLPKCDRAPQAAKAASKFSYHRLRKAVHVACVLVFIVLPLSDLMRFDIPRQRFYFFGYELMISEFAILFFSLMFLMFLIAAMAMLYGRVYCGYLCPQMIFSEASVALESKIQRLVNKHLRWGAKPRKWLSRGLLYAVALAASVILAFVFIAYFVEPRDLMHRLLSLDVKTAGGFAGATVTLVTLLDFLFVRQRFCTTACPYGYLQGMLSDGETLLVQYRDEPKECIECKKCVRVCGMGIDIRNSPYQIECIHCGECIDACVDVLGRLGKQGLIHYVWGERGEVLGKGDRPWYQRLGIRDAKRVVVLLLVLCYAGGLYTALAMRRTVLVRIPPDRATMYLLGSDGTVYNRFRLEASNRGRQQATLILTIVGLPGARLDSMENAVVINPGQTLHREFEIAVPASAGTPPGVNHFRLLSKVGPEQDEFPETFITPSNEGQ